MLYVEGRVIHDGVRARGRRIARDVRCSHSSRPPGTAAQNTVPPARGYDTACSTAVPSPLAPISRTRISPASAPATDASPATSSGGNTKPTGSAALRGSSVRNARECPAALRESVVNPRR